MTDWPRLLRYNKNTSIRVRWQIQSHLSSVGERKATVYEQEFWFGISRLVPETSNQRVCLGGRLTKYERFTEIIRHRSSTRTQRKRGWFCKICIIRYWKEKQSLWVGDLVWISTFNARNSKSERLVARRAINVTVIRIASFDIWLR